MATYEFSSIGEFVSYLDNRAKEMRAQQKKHHNRSHHNAALGRGASEIESIAAMVRSSNLVAVTNYAKAAKSGSVA